MPKGAVISGTIVALAVLLSACGVRGPLETPTGATSTSKAATVTKAGEPAPPPPHKEFVLDGLIR